MGNAIETLKKDYEQAELYGCGVNRNVVRFALNEIEQLEAQLARLREEIKVKHDLIMHYKKQVKDYAFSELSLTKEVEKLRKARRE